MKIITFFSFLMMSFWCLPVSSVRAQEAKPQGGDVLEVQIPRPKFEIFKAWEYGGFWRWDEKDPRFYSDFINRIHRSLTTGPF